MNKLKWFAILLAVLIVATSCYWRPETTTGSLVFTFPELTAKSLEVDPPSFDKDPDKETGKDKKDGEGEEEGPPGKDKKDGGGSDTAGGGKPGEEGAVVFVVKGVEVTHAEIHLYQPDPEAGATKSSEPEEGDDPAEVELGTAIEAPSTIELKNGSTAYVVEVLPGDDYVVLLKLGVVEEDTTLEGASTVGAKGPKDKFQSKLQGVSKPFKVFAGRTTKVQINKLEPPEPAAAE